MRRFCREFYFIFFTFVLSLTFFVVNLPAQENIFWINTGSYPFANPTKLAFLDDNSTIVVLNTVQDGRITKIEENFATQETTVGSLPFDVIAYDGKIFISSYGSNFLTVLSQDDLSEVDVVELNGASSYMALSSDKTKLYISCPGPGIIEVVNLNSLEIDEPVYDENFDLPGKVLVHNGMIFVANSGHSSIVVLSENTKKQVDFLSLPGIVKDMAIINTKLYAVSKDEKAVYIINTETFNIEENIIEIDGTPASLISDNTRYIYIINEERRGSVLRLDSKTDLVVKNWFSTGASPSSGILSSDKLNLYVSNTGENTISYNYLAGELVISPQETLIKPGEKVEFNITGGSGTYRWTTDAGSLDTSEGVSVTYTGPDFEGIFNVVVEDQDSYAKAEAIVSVINLQISPFQITVFDRSPITFNVTGGTLPFEFYSPFGTYEKTGESTCVYTPPEMAGEYYLEVIDKNNHKVSATIVVVTTPLSISPDRKTMAPESTEQFSITGGMPPYTVIHGDGECIDCLDINDSGIIHFKASEYAGESFLSVFDATGNSVDCVISVYDGLFISPSHLYMPVGTTQQLNIIGGTAPYQVQSSSGECQINDSQINFTGTMISDTDVQLTVTDQDGKQFTALITITGDFAVSPENINLSIGESYKINLSGGIKPYIFQATEGEVIKIGEQEFLYTAPEHFGRFKIDFQDSAGSSKTVDVSVNDERLILTPSEIVMYPGESKEIKAIGGLLPYRFSSEKGEIEQQESRIILHAPEESGDFTVTVYDDSGAEFSANVLVIAPIMLNPSILYLSPEEKVMLEVIGGAQGYLFTVESGELSATRGNKVLYTAPQRVGNYWIKVTDALSNSASSMVVVGSAVRVSPSYAYMNRSSVLTFQVSGGFEPYVVVADAGSTPVCVGQALYEYQTPEVSGIYYITVTDSKGINSQIMVEVGDEVISFSPAITLLRSGESAQITLSGGKPPYQVFAQVGSLSEIGQGQYIYEAPDNIELSGDFFIKAEDSAGNKASAVATITQDENESCIAVDDNLDINLPCVQQGLFAYSFTLNFFVNSEFADQLIWKMDMNTLAINQEPSQDCINIADSLTLNIACAEYAGEKYMFELDFFQMPDDSTSLYWNMDLTSFQKYE